jgi:hypothetical protein
LKEAMVSQTRSRSRPANTTPIALHDDDNATPQKATPQKATPAKSSSKKKVIEVTLEGESTIRTNTKKTATKEPTKAAKDKSPGVTSRQMPVQSLASTTATHTKTDDDDENDHQPSPNQNDARKHESKRIEEDDDDDEHDDEEESEKKELAITKRSKARPVRPSKTQMVTGSTGGNELTSLIPGYTAPRALNTSSLDRYRPTGGITELLHKATRADKSTRDFVIDASAARAHASAMQSSSSSHQKYTTAYSSFKMGIKRTPDLTAGAGWFGMKPTPMTDELKTDLAMIRNRSYLDPKRFYKSADTRSSSKVVQHGTVIEGATEFYSSRLTKKQRRANLTEEIMADPESADYARNKYRKMQQGKTEQAEKRKHRGNTKRGPRGY